MKALFIGGTGTISTAISRRLLELGWELCLLNRGNRNAELIGSFTEIVADINAINAINDSNAANTAATENEIAAKIRGVLKPGEKFDCVADFIVFSREQAERDWRLFKDLTRQYIFVSTASVYQKPPANHRVTEGTPLANPFWAYSREKIACEEFFMARYREEGFPVTIVRPSHTYGERSVPLGVHGAGGSWQVLKRMLDGKPVIIHGDGTSLWTMTSNRDFAKGFVGLMGNTHAVGEAVQITSDETVTWNQIYESIARALGVPLRAVHVSSEFLHLAAGGRYDFRGSLLGDKANSALFDNSKLKQLVPGFCATVRFDEGVRETVRYVLSHKECQREDPEFDDWCDRVIAAREKALAELER
ncbi:MAG: NAD-dependent epimerase/dehydratase family protein [Acidobacteriota bacterium]|jgi:nucleoside-diphosphate-sugar epimerase|nr:NAD-dependent epimerase/dehydratase family protein [Acidobacteriota bacterium]